MALEKRESGSGAKLADQLPRREVTEPELEEGTAGIREVAGLAFTGLELEAETTGITGGLGHRGKRRNPGMTPGWRMIPGACELP